MLRNLRVLHLEYWTSWKDWTIADVRRSELAVLSRREACHFMHTCDLQGIKRRLGAHIPVTCN